MNIPEWSTVGQQFCKMGKYRWSVARLIELSKDLEIKEVDIGHLNVYFKYKNLLSRDLVMHIHAIEKADITKPIILDEDGEIMDGRHRVMKAMRDGVQRLPVVRFEVNPSPCSVST